MAVVCNVNDGELVRVFDIPNLFDTLLACWLGKHEINVKSVTYDTTVGGIKPTNMHTIYFLNLNCAIPITTGWSDFTAVATFPIRHGCHMKWCMYIVCGFKKLVLLKDVHKKGNCDWSWRGVILFADLMGLGRVTPPHVWVLSIFGNPLDDIISSILR